MNGYNKIYSPMFGIGVFDRAVSKSALQLPIKEY